MKHIILMHFIFASFHLWWHSSLVNNLPMNCSWAWYNQNFINYICIYVAFLKLRTDETVLNNMFFFNCKSSLPHKNMHRYKTWTGSSHLHIVKTIIIYYSKHPRIRTNGLITLGWNLANKAPFLQEQDQPENCNMFL